MVPSAISGLAANTMHNSNAPLVERDNSRKYLNKTFIFNLF